MFALSSFTFPLLLLKSFGLTFSCKKTPNKMITIILITQWEHNLLARSDILQLTAKPQTNVRTGFWIDSTISNRVHFRSRNEEEGRNRIKGRGSDDDKCHTLNHMFLLKWSDRPKEDLWVCELFVFFLQLCHGCALAQSAPIQTQLVCAGIFIYLH